MVVGVLVNEEARFESKLVDEMVSEAVMLWQTHRAQLCLPAFLQIPERKGYVYVLPYYQDPKLKV